MLGNPVGFSDYFGLEVDYSALFWNTASATVGVIEMVGSGVIIYGTGGTTIPLGAGALFAHGAYNTSNSIIGMHDAIYGTNNPGIAEGLGDFYFGEPGKTVGMTIDSASGLGGVVRSFGKVDSLNDIINAGSTYEGLSSKADKAPTNSCGPNY